MSHNFCSGRLSARLAWCSSDVAMAWHLAMGDSPTWVTKRRLAREVSERKSPSCNHSLASFLDCSMCPNTQSAAEELQNLTPCCIVRKLGVAEKADSTLRSSQAVPHPSTNRALCCLTSEVERDPVHSTRYGRRRHLSFQIQLQQPYAVHTRSACRHLSFQRNTIAAALCS